jgi:ribosomal protein L11 methylase PrmA
MVADKGRTSSYDRALRANIRPGAVVLDIGAGPGIMTFLACRAGAAKVYAVEPDDVIQLAQQIAADNGFSSRIEFIQAMTTEIDLPEKVDGIVADIRGRSPLFAKSIVSIIDARDRFLNPEWVSWLLQKLEPGCRRRSP